MTTWREVAQTYVPAWLQRTRGARFMASLGILFDAFQEATEQGVRARYVSRAPLDALPPHGDDRELPRYLFETDEIYRARLANAFEAYTEGGAGLQARLVEGGFPTAKVYSARDWLVTGAHWATFWVYIPQPNTLFTPTWRIGDGTRIGDGVLISGVNPDAKHRLSGIIRKWKGAHEQCVAVVISVSGAQIGGGWKIGDGTKIGGRSIQFAP